MTVETKSHEMLRLSYCLINPCIQQFSFINASGDSSQLSIRSSCSQVILVDNFLGGISALHIAASL